MSERGEVLIHLYEHLLTDIFPIMRITNHAKNEVAYKALKFLDQYAKLFAITFYYRPNERLVIGHTSLYLTVLRSKKLHGTEKKELQPLGVRSVSWSRKRRSNHSKKEEYMLDLGEVLIVLTVFGSVVTIVKTVADYRVKIRYLEKGPEGAPTKPLNLWMETGVDSSLKWGLVCLFVGVAVLIIQMMPGYFDEKAVLGGMFVAAGLGLLLYYFISDMRKKSSPA